MLVEALLDTAVPMSEYALAMALKVLDEAKIVVTVRVDVAQEGLLLIPDEALADRSVRPHSTAQVDAWWRVLLNLYEVLFADDVLRGKYLHLLLVQVEDLVAVQRQLR